MLRTSRGFTFIELMVVVALIAIVLALAAPSFTATQDRKRLEGVADVFGTDVQYTRSEAVARNFETRLVTGAGNCYTIYVWRGAGTCSCGPAVSCALATPDTDPIELKTVSLAGTGVAVTPNATLHFDPVRGMLNPFVDRSVTFTSSAGPWALTTSVSAVGRVNTCSPSGTLKGYPAC
jgi:type IV fimbrial biogenesis protein FimT